MPLLRKYEKGTMQICSNYSYVFEALAEGLQEMLTDFKATNRIPVGVLDSARDFLETAANATGDKPPVERVIINQNLPREYRQVNASNLTMRIKGLASLLEKLGKTGKIPDSERTPYFTMQRLFQNLSDSSNDAGYTLYMEATNSDDDD